MNMVHMDEYMVKYKCKKYLHIINNALLNLEQNEGIKYVNNFYITFPRDFKDCIPKLNKSLYDVKYYEKQSEYCVSLYK